MLFHVKKFLALELLVSILLAGAGISGIRYFDIAPPVIFDLKAVFMGVGAFIFLSLWNLGVQQGYRFFKGAAYADRITESLAAHFAHATPLQILAGGLTAAIGEELFFRGFMQTAFGIFPASILFGAAHWGGREIRTVSLWAFPQGFLIGLTYFWSGNLAVSMIAHGCFDIAGFLYFRHFMARRATR